ncbi:hypothetical protein INR49_030599 [Caranx melampygus]|nr:hypothetical protein INR49_030599 [Caranx melampygus]
MAVPTAVWQLGAILYEMVNGFKRVTTKMFCHPGSKISDKLFKAHLGGSTRSLSWLQTFCLVYRRCCDNMTLLMKLTMAEAGCSGSNSANMWQTFSAKLPGFFATKPNTLRAGKKI